MYTAAEQPGCLACKLYTLGSLARLDAASLLTQLTLAPVGDPRRQCSRAASGSRSGRAAAQTERFQQGHLRRAQPPSLCWTPQARSGLPGSQRQYRVCCVHLAGKAAVSASNPQEHARRAERQARFDAGASAAPSQVLQPTLRLAPCLLGGMFTAWRQVPSAHQFWRLGPASAAAPVPRCVSVTSLLLDEYHPVRLSCSCRCPQQTLWLSAIAGSNW